MTVQQGKEINALYLGYTKTIDSLKIKSKYYDSAVNQIGKKEDTINLYRFHLENTKRGETFDEAFKERWQKTQELNRFWIFILFMALALVKTE